MEEKLKDTTENVFKWVSQGKFLGYKSPSLELNHGLKNHLVSGFVYKRSDQNKIVASIRGRWHLRHLVLNREEKTLTVSHLGSNSHQHTVIYDWEPYVIRDLSGKGSDTKCKWKHSFILQTKYRIYKFFAPTQEERDLWVESLHLYMGVPVQL
jgi:hypothetical protein